MRARPTENGCENVEDKNDIYGGNPHGTVELAISQHLYDQNGLSTAGFFSQIFFQVCRGQNCHLSAQSENNTVRVLIVGSERTSRRAEIR
jgi:hypothetical protein